MSRFIEIKSTSPKLTQKQVAKHLFYSDFTLTRYRSDMKKISPYRYSEKKHGLKRPQKTSKMSSRSRG